MCITLSSCGVVIKNVSKNSRELFYPIKSKFEQFDANHPIAGDHPYGSPDNYRASFTNKNLFTLRIKEKEKYLKLEDGTVSEVPYRHFYAEEDQILDDKNILEETYLYIDGLTNNKNNGMVILFNTFPVINSTKENKYSDSKRIFLDYTKSMKTGMWLRHETDMYFIFKSGNRDMTIKANVINTVDEEQNEEFLSVNFSEITHPKSLDNTAHKNKMKRFKLKIDSLYTQANAITSNKFDLIIDEKTRAYIVTEYLDTPSLEMKDVFNVKKKKGLPFMSNPSNRLTYIQDNEVNYQVISFEIVKDHKIVFETKFNSDTSFTSGMKFKYKEKYINNLEPR